MKTRTGAYCQPERRKTRTKPTQAASASQLDKWQITVQRISGAMVDGRHLDARVLIAALLRSMRRAERR